MQQARSIAPCVGSSINNNDLSIESSTSSTSALGATATSSGIYPSRPPAQVSEHQQQRGPRHQRQKLQRQKEIFYDQHEVTNTNLTGSAAIAKPSRPVLQRQQRQSSEETTTESVKSSANVHFKEDPEYFEPQPRKIYDPVKTVVSLKNSSPSKPNRQDATHISQPSEVTTTRDFLSHSYGPSSTYAMGFEANSSAPVLQPAEDLLGTSPTSNNVSLGAVVGDSEKWANTFKQHVAQRRALPTTIESFDEDDEENSSAAAEVTHISCIRGCSHTFFSSQFCSLVPLLARH